MPIGVAIVIVAILYFIDKHNAWKASFKIVLLALMLAAAGFGAYATYLYHQSKPRQLAAEAANQPDGRPESARHALPPCPPEDYSFVDANIKCDATPDVLPKYFFDNSNVRSKYACYDIGTGKLDSWPELPSAAQPVCQQGKLLVTK